MALINSRTVLALLTVCLLAAGIVFYAMAAKDGGAEVAAEDSGVGTAEEVAEATEDETEDVPEGSTQVNESHALLSIDPNDERYLVGESTDVFFGRVTEQSGSEGVETNAGNVVPQTQFSVEVQEAIKGDATGTVTVNQEAGYEDDGHTNHKHLRQFDGDQLLETGQEYLFYTIYEEGRGVYTLTAPVSNSHVQIDDKTERSKEREEAKQAKAEERKADPSGPPEPPAGSRPGRPCPPDGRTPPPEFGPCDPSAPRPGKADVGEGKANLPSGKAGTPIEKAK